MHGRLAALGVVALPALAPLDDFPAGSSADRSGPIRLTGLEGGEIDARVLMPLVTRERLGAARRGR